MKVVLAGGSGPAGHSSLIWRRAATTSSCSPGILSRRSRRPAGRLESGRKSAGDRCERVSRRGQQEIDGAGASSISPAPGSPTSAGRAARKRRAAASRVLSTRSLVAAVRAATARPTVFIQGSAVGFYGTGRDGIRRVVSAWRRICSATMCVAWEAEAHPVCALGPRLVIVPIRRRARKGRRRAAANGAAVQVLRRRARRVRPSVLVVDSPRRLARVRHVGARDTSSVSRRLQRHIAGARHERGVLKSDRPRAPPAELAPRARHSRCACSSARWPTTC